MKDSLIIPTEYICNDAQAEQHIKDIWGDIKLYKHYFAMDNLYAWFIDKPDKYYQNYIAQMGKANLVIDYPPEKTQTVSC